MTRVTRMIILIEIRSKRRNEMVDDAEKKNEKRAGWELDKFCRSKMRISKTKITKKILKRNRLRPWTKSKRPMLCFSMVTILSTSSKIRPSKNCSYLCATCAPFALDLQFRHSSASTLSRQFDSLRCRVNLAMSFRLSASSQTSSPLRKQTSLWVSYTITSSRMCWQEQTYK